MKSKFWLITIHLSILMTIMFTYYFADKCEKLWYYLMKVKSNQDMIDKNLHFLR